MNAIMDNYPERFEGEVNAILGGLEAAGEFFQRHPHLRITMRECTLYHRAKGGWPDRAAKAFYRQFLAPIVKRDHKEALARPW